MAVRTDDITALLKQQILNYAPSPSQIDVGEVFEIGDGIALASGLTNVMAGELVEFPKTGTLGIALNLTKTGSPCLQNDIRCNGRRHTSCRYPGLPRYRPR